MVIRTFGKIEYNRYKNEWHIIECQPHVCIKLKSIFQKIAKTDVVPFKFLNNPENCHDLLWFMDRYPMSISDVDSNKLSNGRKSFIFRGNELERILIPGYKPKKILLNKPWKARHYQKIGADFHEMQERFVLGDDIGLGKTLTGILTLMNTDNLPGAVVVQTHLPNQWKVDQIEKFTNLRVHVIKGTKPYNLPVADVYIFTYSKLAGWVDVLATGIFKSAIFDECQELRRSKSEKYNAAKRLSDNVRRCMGMSATPIYNYGDEIFNVLNLIKPGSLGPLEAFLREWCEPYGQEHHIVKDTAALGTYLRDQHLFLRRTRQEVGRELPPINKIIYPVSYDEKEIKSAMAIAEQLAIKVTSGAFVERGQAARELNALVRHTTGVSKAKEVAEFCKLFLENKIPIVLAGWHRQCFIKGTEVLMYNGGIKKIEDIVNGDMVMGPDSKPRQVLSYFKDFGYTTTVTPKKGTPFTCSNGHILTTEYDTSKRKIVKHTTINDLLKTSNRKLRNHTLMRTNSIFFPEREKLIEPWLIGYWIGDGAKNLRTLRVSSADTEVIKELGNISKRHKLKLKIWKSLGASGKSTCKQLCLTTGTQKGAKDRNFLTRYFRNLGLNGKTIPADVKCASVEDRINVLAGLIDSDGHVYKNACGADYATISLTLANDVAFICRSLGLAAYVVTKKMSNGTYRSSSSEFYKVTISGDMRHIPTIVKRKKFIKRNINKRVNRVGFNLKNAGKQEYFGIEVDGDNLFTLSDFTIVHNCYNIWLKELAEYDPVLYTGSESPKQKQESVRKFVSGETNLFILSLRSGIGIDGLQHRCKDVVFGELDWSPKVHDQVTGRVDRDGRKVKEQVNAYYCITDFGSDPVMVEILGLKNSQSEGIINPLTAIKHQHSDQTNIRMLAEFLLKNKRENLN